MFFFIHLGSAYTACADEKNGHLLSPQGPWPCPLSCMLEDSGVPMCYFHLIIRSGIWGNNILTMGVRNESQGNNLMWTGRWSNQPIKPVRWNWPSCDSVSHGEHMRYCSLCRHSAMLTSRDTPAPVPSVLSKPQFLAPSNDGPVIQISFVGCPSSL